MRCSDVRLLNGGSFDLEGQKHAARNKRVVRGDLIEAGPQASLTSSARGPFGPCPASKVTA
jgi:hypothetical protein